MCELGSVPATEAIDESPSDAQVGVPKYESCFTWSADSAGAKQRELRLGLGIAHHLTIINISA